MPNRFDEAKHARATDGKFAQKPTLDASDEAADAARRAASMEHDPETIGTFAHDTARLEWGDSAEITEIAPGVYNAVPADPERLTDPGGYVAIVGAADMPDDLLRVAQDHGFVQRHVHYASSFRKDRIEDMSTVAASDDPEFNAWEQDMRERSPQVEEFEAIVGSDLDNGWRVISLTCPEAGQAIRNAHPSEAPNGDPHWFSEQGMLADVEKHGYTGYASDYRSAAGLPQPSPADRCTLEAERSAGRATAAFDGPQQQIKEGQSEALSEAASRLRGGVTESELWDEARKAGDECAVAPSDLASARAIGRRAGWLTGIEATRGGVRLQASEIARRLQAPEPASA